MQGEKSSWAHAKPWQFPHPVCDMTFDREEEEEEEEEDETGLQSIYAYLHKAWNHPTHEEEKEILWQVLHLHNRLQFTGLEIPIYSDSHF